MLRRKDVGNSSASGDGTGYSITVTNHYETYAEKLKDYAKEQSKPERKENEVSSGKKRFFSYAFRLMDLESGMYIVYGLSIRSKKETYDRSTIMLKSLGIDLDPVRFDRYYSASSYVDQFGEARVYLVKKKNTTLNGSSKWKSTVRDFAENIIPFLEQHHPRSNSGSGFAADKKMLGWGVAQRGGDRIDRALMSIGVWHNPLQIGK
ncbi:MAG: hypothetical protein QXJ24_06645 [Thermoplasmatales archaeon]